MIYLNIILSLLFLVLLLMFLSNLVFNIIGRKEHKEMKEYNKTVNKVSLELHEEILNVLKDRLKK